MSVWESENSLSDTKNALTLGVFRLLEIKSGCNSIDLLIEICTDFRPLLLQNQFSLFVLSDICHTNSGTKIGVHVILDVVHFLFDFLDFLISLNHFAFNTTNERLCEQSA